METREQIEAILKGKYGNQVERKGNSFNVIFDLTIKERQQRIAELKNVYQFLKGTLKRKVALNPRASEGRSSIGSIDIVEEHNPYLPEIKIYAKPRQISPNLMPGMANEDAFLKVIRDAINNAKGLNKDVTLIITPRVSGSSLKITKVREISKINVDNPNHKVDFRISSEGGSKTISLKQAFFPSWTGAGTLKKEVENLLDDALSKGALIRPGIEYKFAGSLTGVARRATKKEIEDNIFGTIINAVVISDISKDNIVWDESLNTLTLTVNKCYQKTNVDVGSMLNDVYLYVGKSGTGLFGKYKGFRAQFVPSSRVEASTMISSI